MNLQPPPRTLAGQAASPGLVLGRVLEWSDAVVTGGAPRALGEALAEAQRQLQALRDATHDEAAQTLIEFQIEFLGDPALLEPAQVA